ncbi:MAG: mechanosensitive ion channel protein MscS [Alphaproteobacteria bacterium]|nr:mechanosensitive ion channel protein MscS [Alphaproteobacteria bacterium]|tara:strand:+ start:547 stop:1389 length:843 start_codon:yes stop_codon:yes gene_type:complete
MESATVAVSDQIELVIEALSSTLTTYGLSVVGAIVTLIVGVWFAGYASRLTGRALEKTSRVDDTLSKFFASFIRYLVLAVVVVAVLNQFGVETASLVAVLATAGLAIGLALQGTLTNVASGVMLLFFRPFKVGDYVEAGGHAGTIQELNLFFTVMATPDNVRITVPNGQVWGSAVHNYSANSTRRVDISAGIAYDADIDKAMAVVHETISADTRIKSDPGPFVAVTEMADSSVNFTIRVWVDNADVWPVKFDLTKAVKQAFDRNGIDIPFPTRTVHMAEK